MQDVIKARLEQKLEQFLRSRGAGRQPSEREDLTESTREAVSARREMPVGYQNPSEASNSRVSAGARDHYAASRQTER
jgi:hypothetical protein